MAAAAAEAQPRVSNHHRFLQSEGARRAAVTGEAHNVAVGKVAGAVRERYDRMKASAEARRRQYIENDMCG